jgi:hypothetical protein
MGNRMTLIKLSIVACVALFTASCSSITPNRVITAEDDKTAVGLRYYETRPFVVVRRPYVIASEPYLVHGVLQPDGRTFVVVDAPQELKMPTRTALTLGTPKVVGKDGDGGATVAEAHSGDAVSTPADPAKPAEPDTGCIDSDGKRKSAAKEDPPDGEPEGSAANPDSKVPECKDTTGSRIAFSGISLETDLTATALVPINDLFSIIYLPDYDREFVVDVKARWGFSKLHITRGPGGTLLAYNSEVDNSAVVKPLLDSWNTLVSAATQAAVVKITPPTAQSADVPARSSSQMSGTPATLRIHVAKYAVPGVYPILKPAEISSGAWSTAGGPAMQDNNAAVKPSSPVPESAEDGKKPAGAAVAGKLPAAHQRALAPYYPYQVPYDYFTVLLAEHLLEPAGASGVVSGPVGQEGAAQSGGTPMSPPSPPPAARNCPPAQRKAAASSTGNTLNLDLAGAGLANAIKSAKTTTEGPAGCAQKMAVAFDSAVTDEATLEAALKAKYPNTEFDASAAP